MKTDVHLLDVASVNINQHTIHAKLRFGIRASHPIAKNFNTSHYKDVTITFTDEQIKTIQSQKGSDDFHLVANALIARAACLLQKEAQEHANLDEYFSETSAINTGSLL